MYAYDINGRLNRSINPTKNHTVPSLIPFSTEAKNTNITTNISDIYNQKQLKSQNRGQSIIRTNSFIPLPSNDMDKKWTLSSPGHRKCPQKRDIGGCIQKKLLLE